jgi:hypothetical protein
MLAWVCRNRRTVQPLGKRVTIHGDRHFNEILPCAIFGHKCNLGLSLFDLVEALGAIVSNYRRARLVEAYVELFTRLSELLLLPERLSIRVRVPALFLGHLRPRWMAT